MRDIIEKLQKEYKDYRFVEYKKDNTFFYILAHNDAYDTGDGDLVIRYNINNESTEDETGIGAIISWGLNFNDSTWTKIEK